MKEDLDQAFNPITDYDYFSDLLGLVILHIFPSKCLDASYCSNMCDHSRMVCHSQNRLMKFACCVQTYPSERR